MKVTNHLEALALTCLLVALMVLGCAAPSPTAAPVPAPKPAPAPTVAPAPAPAPAPAQSPAPAPKPSPSPTSAAGQAQSGGNFVWAHNGGLNNLGAPADMSILDYRNPLGIYETLLRVDENEHIIPWLAESWKIAPDNKSITINLRKGVKFHDGTDFNAEAVKFNLEADKAAKIPGTAYLTKISSFDVLDPYTIRFNLTQFDATILLRLGQSAVGFMASPTAMKKQVPTDQVAKEHTVGTGPFKFDSWERTSFLKMVKNPNYWQPGKPNLDSITVKNIADVTVSLMSFKAGEVFAVENIDPNDAKRLAGEGYEIWSPTLAFLHSMLPDGNNPKSPFANRLVREAVEYAIDKKTMAQGIGMGYYQGIGQVAMPGSPYYNPDIKPREYNPAKAKQLLAEAGYPTGFKTKLTSDVRVRKDALVATQQYLKEVGIETTLDMADVARFSSITRGGWEGLLFPGFPNSGNFTGYIARWGLVDDYISFYRPPGWQQKWDAMIAQPDDNLRAEQMKEIMKIIYDECLAIPYQGDRPLMVLQKGKVNNFKFHYGKTPSFYTPEDVWLSK